MPRALHPLQQGPVLHISGAIWGGEMLWLMQLSGAEVAVLIPVEPELFFSPRPTAALGQGAANLQDAFPVRYGAFWAGPLPLLQKVGGRREGTPGLQISIKGLVRGLWGHLLVLFSLFTPALILGVLIKSVINVKIFYRPIKVPKQK